MSIASISIPSCATPHDDTQPIHTSALLESMIATAPADYFTLDWFVGHLPKRSFGVILLFLALIALLPVICVPAMLLISVLVSEIILGYQAPVLPQRIMMRRLPSRYLIKLKYHVVPTLKCLESIVRPRWCFVLKARRLAAFIGLMLTVLSLMVPIPFANVPAAAICILLALSYIEHDGVLFSVTAVFAIGFLTSLMAVFVG